MNQRQFVAHVQALRNDGVSVRGIAEALGVPRGRVQRTLQAAEAHADADLESAFVGRERELRDLRAALAAARAGHSSVVFVVGEAGVGKTRLVRELTAGAAMRRTVVATGRCYEDGAAPPYRPWTELLRQLRVRLGPAWLGRQNAADRTALSALLPELALASDEVAAAGTGSAAGAVEARFRLFDALGALIMDAARMSPLVLVLEDLHAADESSLDLLEFVGRQLEGARALVIGTYRDGELGGARSSAISRLGRVARVRHVRLARLSREEVGKCLAYVVPDPAQPLIDLVFQRTEGNAFYVAQLVNLLDAGAVGEVSGGPLHDIPEGVRQAVMGRLVRVSPEARALLLIASIVGREFDVGVLASVANVPAERLPAWLDEGMAAGLLEAASGVRHYRFAHALGHQAIELEVGPARAAELHQRTADVLDALPAAGPRAAETLAHLEAAGSAARPERVAACARAAGEQALTAYAFAEAVAYFERVLALRSGAPMDDDQAAALLGLARATAFASGFADTGDAVRYLRRGFDYYREQGDLAQALAVIEAPLMSYQDELVQAHTELVAALLPDLPPGSLERGRALAVQGALVGMSGDLAAGERALEEALEIARAVDAPLVALRALVGRANVRSFHSRTEPQHTHAAIQLARRLGARTEELFASWIAAVYYCEHGEREPLISVAGEALEFAERMRSRYFVEAFAITLAGLHSYRGEWDEARAYLARVADPLAASLPYLATAALLELRAGRRDRAAPYFEELVRRAEASEFAPVIDRALVIPVLVLAGRISDEPPLLELANALSAPFRRPVEDRTTVTIQYARAGMGYGAALRDDGEGASAAYTFLVSTKSADWNAVVGPTSLSSQHVLGLLALTLGKVADASAHFERAIAFCRRVGYLPELAWSCIDGADALTRPGRTQDLATAISLLDEATAIANALGMTYLARPVAAIRSRIDVAPRRDRARPAGLTERELGVLRLVAEGQTNRGIAQALTISDRTVANHVRSILNKTGSSNRTEAAMFAARHALLGDTVSG